MNLLKPFAQTDTRSTFQEPLPYYLLIVGRRIVRFILFTSVLALCEMPTGSFRILTCVAMSISYDDNHYTMSIYAYLPNPSAQVGYDTRSIFKRSSTGLKSEFSFS